MENHEIVYLPSISALAEIRKWRKARATGGKGVAWVVDPVYRSDDVRLKKYSRPPSVTEAKAVDLKDCTELARVVATSDVLANRDAPALRALGQTIEKKGFGATVASVKGAELREARIVHFGAHACLSAEPELSAIALSQWNERGQRIRDSLLHVKDVYDLQWKADLVVLAACETALGGGSRSGGVYGLSRAFHYGGVPSVVASLWKVPADGTGDLMDLFYTKLGGNLKTGMRPAAALRGAQIALIGSSPKTWAAFTLEGEWKPFQR